MEEVDVDGGRGRTNHVLTGLDPGEEYPVTVLPLCLAPGDTEYHRPCEGFKQKGCSLKVKTKASKGHSCVLHTDTDYRDHDMIFGHGGAEAAKVEGVGGPEECCRACASVKPNRPYSDVCTRFVYEKETDTCYFKAPDAEDGREEREGYIAGKVVPK
mmetsp:Transcript_34468/g.84426  ORF Transcript_34468/g.84426 Transcript_34468/m.84426 type:complete len:157 (-) Transcript_34468:305-775(-)